MAFYTGYFDESGHETADLFFFGGLILDVEEPSAFERDWLAAIAPLAYLHTSDFIGGRDDFEQWNSLGLDGKVQLLERAARVVERYSLQTFSLTLVMDDYRRLNDERIFSEAIAHPYALCARFSSVQVGNWSRRQCIPGRIKLVFENRQGIVGETAAVFERDQLLPPIFEDKSVCALQSADFIAWLYQAKVRRSHRYAQMRSVHAELNQFLHTDDLLDYNKLLEICQKAPRGVPKREEFAAEVFFHSSPKVPRKKYRKK